MFASRSQLLGALAPLCCKLTSCQKSVAHRNHFLSNCAAKHHLKCLDVIVANDPSQESALNQVTCEEEQDTERLLVIFSSMFFFYKRHFAQ